MGRIRSAVLITLIALGCGTSYKTVPVTGKVTDEGKPLANAVVFFVPTSDGCPSATGTTDANGEYKLSLSLSAAKGYEGAVPGDYKVTVSKKMTPDGKELPVAAPGSVPVPALESLPDNYSNAVSTTLTAKVTDSGGRFDFSVSTGGKAPKDIRPIIKKEIPGTPGAGGVPGVPGGLPGGVPGLPQRK